MRINVYAEELTDETTVVEKTADTGRTFFGARIFMDSPDSLHHSEEDDDRTAITFWIPWSKKSGHDGPWLAGVLRDLADKVEGVAGGEG